MLMRHVKALVLVIAVGLLLAKDTSAQVGIFAGGVSSTASVKVDGVDLDVDGRLGFSGGVTYATGGTFGLFFGGYWTQKGFDLVAPATGSVKLSYIEVPVMAVVRLPIIGRTLGPRLYGGVNLGFETGCSTSGDITLLAPFTCDETNGFDFGLKGGLGLQVLVIGLDLAYVYGLTDIAKADTVEIKNRSWVLTLSLGVG
jgi:hypothetical protein